MFFIETLAIFHSLFKVPIYEVEIEVELPCSRVDVPEVSN